VKRNFISAYCQLPHSSAEIQFFSGLMPSAIAELLPDLWINDDEEAGKK